MAENLFSKVLKFEDVKICNNYSKDKIKEEFSKLKAISDENE